MSLGERLVRVNPRRHTDTVNFSAIIDIPCSCHLQSRIRRNQRVQVDNRAVFPKNRMVKVVIKIKLARKRIARHLTVRIDGVRPAEAVTIQAPEIDGYAVSPEVSIEWRSGKGSRTNKLPCVVDPLYA